MVGTAASLAAKVAVGGHDPVSRALAGWPAISLLVSIKMLFSMFDHDKDDHRTVRDDQRTVPDRPGRAGPPGTSTGPGTAESGPAVRGGGALEVRDVAHLIPAARAARNALAASGQTVSRDRLADRMRDDGHGVSNARASLLLKILKAEENVTQPEPVPAASHGGDQGQVAS